MWNIVQCAVQGRGHIKTKIPCQDKTKSKKANEVQVIALADGAGSANLSHLGAEYVTNAICDNLTECFDMYYLEEDGVAIKRKIVNDLLCGLEKIANDNSCDLKDLASTLLMVAVKDEKYIIIHIGDGVIGYLKNGQLKIASHPQNGEFVNTTVFVTSRDVLSSMKILKGNLGEIDGFAIMSDGTEASFYNKRDKSLIPAVKKLMELTRIIKIQSLEYEIYRSFDGIVKNNTTDDCSIVLMVKDDLSFEGYNNLSYSEKKSFLMINKNIPKRTVERYGEILNYLEKPTSLDFVAKRIHLKKKYTKRHLDFLQERNLITKDGNKYYTSVILNKK